MNIHSTSSLSNYLPGNTAAPAMLNESADKVDPVDDAKLKETFNQFVGETFFSQLIKSMRSSLGKPAYFHGGRAEEVFQGQLDQMLSEQFAESSSETFAAPMFELFQLQRQQ